MESIVEAVTRIQVHGLALGVGILGGCVGVLVDLDHAFAVKFHKPDRWLHKTVFAVSGLAIVGILSYLGRFHSQ